MNLIKFLWCLICIVLSLLLSSITCEDKHANRRVIIGGHEGHVLGDEIHNLAVDLIINETLDKEDNGDEDKEDNGDEDEDDVIEGASSKKDNNDDTKYELSKYRKEQIYKSKRIIPPKPNELDILHSNIPKTIDTTSEFLDTYKPSHVWYAHKTWRSLFSNEKDKAKYLDDINVAYYRFYFNWRNVFDKVVPYVKHEPREAIGIIRCKDDGKTLYVNEMEVCNHSRTSISKDSTYIASIHSSLVTKYFNKPCYFVFHTHPKGVGDPWPSDNDIEILLEYNYHNRHLAHVVVSEYGAIIYFLDKHVMTELRSQGKLTFYTFCYDLLSAWNACTFSAFNVKNSDLIDLMSKFGLHIIIIPSPAYISESYRFNRTGSILVGRFIHDRDRVLTILRTRIKELEKKEESSNKRK
jgi:proteasome lid subunit RPN8/RPN11